MFFAGKSNSFLPVPYIQKLIISFRFLKIQNLGYATSKCRTMQNTYPSGPILKAGLEGACPVERCLPIPGFHRNGGMLNFCKVLSQLVSIPLLFIAVICVQSALLAPWRKCHLFTLVLISVFTVLAKTIQFIQLKSFLLAFYSSNLCSKCPPCSLEKMSSLHSG